MFEVIEIVYINNNQSSFRHSVQVVNTTLDKQSTHFINSARYLEQRIKYRRQLST